VGTWITEGWGPPDGWRVGTIDLIWQDRCHRRLRGPGGRDVNARVPASAAHEQQKGRVSR
ncbi:hypothetical protein, partial [Pseudonocardia bannensis]|uniref:hypothetical protein n=1 Tax=Pseudonocardia bannensis TaxID=630973 RepID=UPI001B7D0E21